MSVSQKRLERKKLKRKVRLSQKEDRRLASEAADLFPSFEVVNRSGSDRFAEHVRAACRTVPREHRTRLDRETLRLLLAYRRGEFREASRSAFPGFIGTLTDLCRRLNNRLGEVILGALPPEVRERYVPVEFLEVTPGGRRSGYALVVEVVGLERTRTEGGTAYFSKYRPLAEVQGRHRVMAFTNHAVGRVAERMVLNDGLHVAAHDAHLFVHRCRHYEPVTLPDGQPAVTVYTEASENVSGRIYADRILDEVDPDALYFHRLGYCPVAAHGEFAVAKTFLFPGMRNTPEHALLRRHRLPAAKLSAGEPELTALSFTHMVRSGDFRLLRWFHRSGVPQVLTFEKSLFHEEEPGTLVGRRPYLVPVLDGEPMLARHPRHGRILPLFSATPWAVAYLGLPAGPPNRAAESVPAAILTRETLASFGAGLGCRYAAINPAPGRESEAALLDLRRLETRPTS